MYYVFYNFRMLYSQKHWWVMKMVSSCRDLFVYQKLQSFSVFLRNLDALWHLHCYLVLSALWALTTIWTSLLQCLDISAWFMMVFLAHWQGWFAIAFPCFFLPCAFVRLSNGKGTNSSHLEKVGTEVFDSGQVWAFAHGWRSGHLPNLARRVATEPLRTKVTLVYLIMLLIDIESCYILFVDGLGSDKNKMLGHV